DALKRLRPKLEMILRYREFMAWEIGQELVRHRDGLELGADFLKVKISLNQPQNWKSGTSPGMTLIDAYVKFGRSADARDLLLSQVPAGILTETKDVVSTADFFQAINIGNRLRTLGYPIDAVELYVPAVEHGDVTHAQLVSGLAAALSELSAEALVKYIEGLEAKSRPFSLHLFVDLGRVRTRWGGVLSNISQDAKLRPSLLTAIDRISDESPGKIAALTMSAYLSVVADHPKKSALVINKLIDAERAYVALKTEKAKSSPTFDSTELWLVARECLTRKQLASQGDKLGQRALEASKGQNRLYTTAILKEWMQIAAEAGDQAKCDQLAAELEKKP
ncbi:MAG TPA: hypothetical protein VGM98_00225, partial [Schlesneria sp.]